MTDFSDFIIYADESGDHGLENINPYFPVFCLALIIIRKSHYINKIVPAIQQLKFDFWGHDKIVLHEHEIRKQENDFQFLRTNKELREKFYSRMNKIMADSPYWVVSSVIKKPELQNKYKEDYNPYHIALRFCLEKVLKIMLKEGQKGKKISLLFERRGEKVEDKNLELEFYRTVNNQNQWGSVQVDFRQMEFEILFAGKNHNSSGMQLADMVARPIALKVMRPEQANRAHDIIVTKYNNGFVNKVFP